MEEIPRIYLLKLLPEPEIFWTLLVESWGLTLTSCNNWNVIVYTKQFQNYYLDNNNFLESRFPVLKKDIIILIFEFLFVTVDNYWIEFVYRGVLYLLCSLFFSFAVMDLVLTIFHLLIVFQSISTQHDQKVRLKSVKCVVGNATDLVTIHYCRIKPTRNSTMFILNSTLLKPFKGPMYHKIKFYYKYNGLIYREIINVPEYEVCGMLRNINNAHPLVKAAIDVMGKTIEILLKGCPYPVGNYSLVVEHDYSNFPSIIPSGN